MGIVGWVDRGAAVVGGASLGRMMHAGEVWRGRGWSRGEGRSYFDAERVA